MLCPALRGMLLLEDEQNRVARFQRLVLDLLARGNGRTAISSV